MADYDIGVKVSGAQQATSDLGSIAVAGAAIGAAFYKAIDAFADFDQGLADLSSITGATGKDLAAMGESARDMGLNVTGGATAALKAMEAIGSAKPELLQSTEALVAMTEAANVLAKASGDALPQAAQNLTGIMNQFGASAEQADRYINVLAAGSLEGAANITELAASMQSAGAMAAAFNVPIEETVAALETLADKSIKGAEAGTALRNILTVMSATDALPADALQQLEKFGVDLDRVSNKALPFNERLAELAKIGGDATAIVKVFGKENEVAALALLNNTERAAELTKAVTGTQTAYEQAATRSATFKASMERLQNVAQDLLIDIGALLAPVIQFGAELLANKEALVFVGAALLAYNGSAILAAASTVAMNIATAAQAAYLSASITVQAAYIAITSANATATGIATAAMRLFNVVVASNPLGAAIVAATALGAAFYYLSDSTKALTKEEAYHADLSKQVADGFGKESAGAAILFDKLEKLNPKSAEAKTVRDEINTTYKAYLPNLLTEATSLEGVAKAQDAVNAALLTKIRLQVKEQELTRAITVQQTAVIEAYNSVGKATGASAAAIQKAISSVQATLAKGSEDQRLATLQASGDFDALARELAKVSGAGVDVQKTINDIAAAGLGLEFLDAAGAVSITEDSIKSLLAFMDEVPASAKNAGKGLGNDDDGLGGQAIAAAGSIDALNAQLSKLRDEFNATGSASMRMSLGQDIAELETTLERVTAQGAPLDSFIVKTQDVSAALTDMGAVAQRSMRDASQLAADAAGSFTAAEPAILSFKGKLIEALGEGAVGELEKGLQNIGQAFMDFGVSAATSIGYAIGAGEDLGEAFRKSVTALLVEVPKLAGMALLNAAATTPSPASLPMAVAGLALLGLSGIVKGVEAGNDAKLQAAKDAGAMPSISSQAEAGGLTGLSVTSNDPFAGRTIILNVDGREVEAAVTTRQDEKQRLRGG